MTEGWTAIAAMAANRVIGVGGKLPWHCPEDFQWFKATTMGHVLLMGRKTFESIGRPLPGRETWVLTRTNWEREGTQIVRSVEEALRRSEGRRVFIAGGGEVYRVTLPWWREVLLTRFKHAVEGDAWFPEFESDFLLAETIRETAEFRIERWMLRDSASLQQRFG
ncbi:MAG: dihydrofolate reductase [Candidatus Methylacidiphilales bacterium]